MPRLLPPDPLLMDDHQRRVYDAIMAGPRGRVRGPLAVWLHRPGLAEHAQALGQYCRYDSSLHPALSELAILTIAAWWRSDFEWWAHAPIAVKAGVPEAAVEAIRRGTPPELPDEEQAMVYEFATTLLKSREVPDAVYDRAVALLGRDRVVDLVGVCGYYTLISMTLNVFRIPAPEDAAPQFEPQHREAE